MIICSFVFSRNCIPVRIMVDPETILGTLGMRCEYIRNAWELRALSTHFKTIFSLPMGNCESLVHLLVRVLFFGSWEENTCPRGNPFIHSKNIYLSLSFILLSLSVSLTIFFILFNKNDWVFSFYPLSLSLCAYCKNGYSFPYSFVLIVLPLGWTSSLSGGIKLINHLINSKFVLHPTSQFLTVLPLCIYL